MRGLAISTAAAWPEPVERVSAALREAGAEARIEEFSRNADRGGRGAAVGCELRQIVKSLLFDCDGAPVLVLVSGDRRADAAKVAAATGAGRARVAGAAQVEDGTGYAPGAVAPVGLAARGAGPARPAACSAEGLVWVGAGTTRHMAGLPPAELVRVSRAERSTSPRTRNIPDEEGADMQETEKIWMNGELVDWADARIHVAAHGLHYGTGCLRGHPLLRRPSAARRSSGSRAPSSGSSSSAKLLYMELPYSARGAAGRLPRDDRAPTSSRECYVRPIAFYGYGELGVHTGANPVDVAVICFPWGAYLGEDEPEPGDHAR